VLSLALLNGDCVTDKLDWTFRLYDLKRDGVISSDELLDVIGSVYDLLGDSQILPSAVQQHADSVFQVRLSARCKRNGRKKVQNRRKRRNGQNAMTQAVSILALRPLRVYRTCRRRLSVISWMAVYSRTLELYNT